MAFLRELGPVYGEIDRRFDSYVKEIQRYLRQPSFSQTGEGIKEGAEMVYNYVKSIPGADCEMFHPKDGNPIVYGKIRSSKTGSKTLLVYSHYDVVTVPDPQNWTFPPFAAEIVDADKIGLSPKLGKVIVSRGSHDRKGHNLAFILTLKTIKEVTGDLPLNILLVMEGEEEIASPSLTEFRDKHLEELRQADAAYTITMRQDETGLHWIYRGMKGIVHVEFIARGPTIDGKDLFAGDAVWVDTPLPRLIHALATIVDSNGRPTIDDFDENYVLTEEDKEELKMLRDRFDEEMFRTRLGVKGFKDGKPGKDLVGQYFAGPVVNIDGMISGYVGPRFQTILPMHARALVDIRIVPNMSPDEVVTKMRRHLDRRGFNDIEINVVSVTDWSRTSRDAAPVKAAITASEIHGVDYIVLPTFIAGNPSYLWNRPPLNLPHVSPGLGHGERYHRQDEYLRVEGIRDYMKYMTTYLHIFGGSVV